MLMALGIYICYQRQSVQEASQVCDAVVPCLSISWPGAGVGAGGGCLESAKFLTLLTLQVLVSDQLRVHYVLGWNKVLTLLLSDGSPIVQGLRKPRTTQESRKAKCRERIPGCD